MREFIIADNQDITKAGILFLLEGIKDIPSIREADNKAELVYEIRQKSKSVIILDYTLFDFSGVDELLVLRERFPEVSWLLFSDELSEDFLRRTIINSQSFSVVMKDSSKEEILSALQSSLKGERFICNHVSNLLLNSQLNTPTRESTLLTNTEKIILKEIALGKTTKEIATERNLSFHTINSHRKNIFRKLQVNNVHEATKYAMRAGIVDLAEYYI